MGAYKQLDYLVGELKSLRTQRMTHSEVEEMIKAEGWELLRRLLQAHVDERSTAEVNEAVVGVGGKERTHERGQQRDLESIFGTVEVKRTGYGGRGEQSLHPVDAELNLPAERYSHGVRRVSAEQAAQDSFDEVVKAVKEYTGAHVPKRQVEELVVRAPLDFVRFYQQQRQVGSRSTHCRLCDLGRKISESGRASNIRPKRSSDKPLKKRQGAIQDGRRLGVRWLTATGHN